MPDEIKVPTNFDLTPDVLIALHQLGGEAKVEQIINLVKEIARARLDLPDEVFLVETKKKKKSKKDNIIRFQFKSNSYFALYPLLLTEFTEKVAYGIRGLTPKGNKKIKELKIDELLLESFDGPFDSELANNLQKFAEEVKEEYKEKYKALKKEEQNQAKQETTESELDEDGIPEEETLESDLEDSVKKDEAIESDLEIIRSLDPYKFEKMCSKLFEEAGYIDVETTPSSGDEGIDGYGFISQKLTYDRKIVWQVKKYGPDKIINKSVIEKLDYDRQKAFGDKAVFITTASFAPSARKEADKLSITLIDGTKLVELLKECNLGYTKDLDGKLTISKEAFENF